VTPVQCIGCAFKARATKRSIAFLAAKARPLETVRFSP
jgi:hypothetical protein